MGKKFLTYIIATLAIGIILSAAYYYAVCHGLRHTKEFFPGRLNVILYDTTHYDAVFVGTSRVSKCVDPLIFDSITHLHSYNAGLEGASYTVIDIMTRKFIKNHHPRYVFINLDIYTLENEHSLYDFPQYFPHLKDPDIASFSQRKPELTFGKYAPFIAISYIDDYLKGAALNEQLGLYPADDLTYAHRGFSPNIDSTYYGDTGLFQIHFTYDTANFKKLDSLCRYCREQQCEVIFILSPIYGSYTDQAQPTLDFFARLTHLEAANEARRFDHYSDARFTKDMFANRTHLNRKGADLYTRLLAKEFLGNEAAMPEEDAGK